jgi:hypothetical protein
MIKLEDILTNEFCEIIIVIFNILNILNVFDDADLILDVSDVL